MSNDNDDYNAQAKALAAQAHLLDEERRRTAHGPDIEKTLRVIDYAAMAPAGHPDPKGYVLGMVSKGSDGVESTNTPTTGTSTRPRVLGFESQGFTRVPADAKPGDVVSLELPGGRVMTAEVELAVRQGFLKRDRDGGYRAFGDDEIAQEKAEQQRQQQQDEQQQKADIEQKRLTGDAPDADLQRTLDTINRIVPSATAEALVEDYIANGGISLDNLQKVAAHVGITFQQAQALVDQNIAGVRRQAELALSTVGIPPEEVDAVYAFASENHILDHKGAVRSLAFANDTSAYRDLAEKYKAWKRLREQR
jgi:hypothetical protein